jgi:16S rRNA (guanine527-N7)-methyltransferase
MPAFSIDSAEWKQLVCDGAKEMGVVLGKDKVDKMARHCLELMRWNAKINLTAITDPMEVAVKHVLDSLAVLSLLSDNMSVLDLGSGGGFPGMVLKIANPGLTVVLVEASRKKVSFLKQVIRVLSLTRIEAIHARIEDIRISGRFQEAFDAAICRAFTSLSEFVKQAWPLVQENGLIIAYKGKEANREIEDLISKKGGNQKQALAKPADFSIWVRPYRLPYLNLERSLIVIKKNRTKEIDGNPGAI